RTQSSARPYDEADVALLVGTRMEEFQSGLWKLVPRSARIVQVDVDPSEIGKNLRPDAAVVGDARVVLEQLAAASPKAAPRPSTAELVFFKEDFERRVDEECSLDGDGPLRTKQVLHAANRVLGPRTIL